MSQPRLPGTIPSPKVAREQLLIAKGRVRVCERNLETQKEAIKELRTLLGSAEATRRQAEDDLESSDGPGCDKAHAAAVKARAEAAANLAAGVRARKSARQALKEADAERSRADEELQAAREGRRRDDAGTSTDPTKALHAVDQ